MENYCFYCKAGCKRFVSSPSEICDHCKKKDKDVNDLYNMKLHEEKHLGGWSITRVPSGWIYRTNREGSEVFVPFNNEFQELK